MNSIYYQWGSRISTLITIVIFSFLLIVCNNKTSDSKDSTKNNNNPQGDLKKTDNNKDINKKIAPVKKKPGSDYFADDDPIQEDLMKPVYNNTARFIAGLSVDEPSKLYKLSKTRNYLNYKQQINKLWTRLQSKNISIIRKWREKNLPAEYNKMIFYPFSGPDMINPIAFFEDGRDFILYGLERIGSIPQPHKTHQQTVMNDLWRIHRALNTILHINFFKTIDMRKDVGEKTLSSVTGIMMFFLSRLSYEVVYIKKIWLDNNSKVINNTGKDSKTKNGVKGVEIVFRKNSDSPLKRVRYYQIDISNPSLLKHKNFVKYLNSQKTFTTIIKSASYLLHNNVFGKIRDIILSKSSQVLQDDTGVPIRFYTKGKWKLTYFGYYVAPITLFRAYYQKALRDGVKKMSKARLPFRYGYHYRPGESHLIFAVRNQ